MIVYVDMVADLFHYGHVNFLRIAYNKYIKNTNNKLYIGIHNDDTVKSYKRTPVLNMEERINVIKSCKYIDKIIPNAPLKITEEYIEKYNINIICIPDNRETNEIKEWYKNISHLNIKFKKIPYSNSISTSEIIKRIKNREDL